ncbi:hypothetical protein N9241_01710 [bacterium]|nr:hypothetical protein [bacterium]
MTATVTDSGGLSGSDSITITVGTPVAVQTHVGGLSGTPTAGSRNRWNASVEIDVHESSHGPVANALVEGSWSNGTNGSVSCVTDASGSCSVNKNNLKGNVSSVTFSIDNISGDGITYQSGNYDVNPRTEIFNSS